jgi:LPPG:FO 2-phospho-L-lactate transferase
MITSLAGGVGAARFLQGLVKLIPEESLTVIVNTGDDLNHYGLHISPDLDIVMYTLAGIVDENRGWGIKEDTFHCLQMLQQYGNEPWFKLGDRDLATHIQRTRLLRNGVKLSEVTASFCEALGLKVKLIPMTDEKVETMILTDKGRMHFQEYLVKRESQDKVINVNFEGSEKAYPAPRVIDSILNCKALIICPSNPIVSIGTILSIPGITDALKKTKAKVIAISPIVAGAPIKGPADKLMKGLGIEVSAYGVAVLYKEFLDAFIIDNEDEKDKHKIQPLGLHVISTNTIMRRLEDKIHLAEVVLNLIKDL